MGILAADDIVQLVKITFVSGELASGIIVWPCASLYFLVYLQEKEMSANNIILDQVQDRETILQTWRSPEFAGKFPK